MDNIEDRDGHPLSRGNEYPELDYTPVYPWAGALNELHRPPSTSQDLYPGLRHGNERNHEALGELETSHDDSYGSNFMKDDIDDDFVDPDFELPEEDIMSEEPTSEMDWESPSSGEDDRSVRARPGGKARGKRAQGHVREGAAQRRTKRGQRKPLEPSVEFKALHSQATMAFIDHDYEEAEQLALQAIGVNPEMFPAHSLLSEIHMARGHPAKALAALFNGAHTRPRDTQVWLKVGQLILERAAEDKLSAVRDSLYCYNRVIAVDKTDVRARYKRAALNRDLGNIGKAAYDYEYLLIQFPHEPTILRLLAEIYIDLDDVDKAFSHYNHSLCHYRVKEPEKVISLTWSDINVYAELYGIRRQYENGLNQIRSLSRWLLGRGKDLFWENFDADDREWDSKDEPRRIHTAGFMPGHYKANSYGDGLPLELRIKLGIYRLNLGDEHLGEAINHFEWLDPKDHQPGAKLFDYPDLFREVADCFRKRNLLKEALQFYEPLQHVSDYTDTSYLADMAICYRAVGESTEAISCYQTIIDNGGNTTDAQVQVARMCEELGIDINSVKGRSLAVVESRESNQTSKVRVPQKSNDAGGLDPEEFAMIVPRLTRRPIRDIRALEESMMKQAKAEDAHTLFLQMQKIKETAREDDLGHKFQWMLAAETLIQDFQSERLFFPWDRYVRFYGYSKEARKKALNMRPADVAAEAVTRRLGLRSVLDDWSDPVPNEFRGISFRVWLDIFLEYAMALSQSGDVKQAYEVICSASNANVFYHCQDSLLLIYVCWLTCALMANDAETLCSVARWFIKEYQFVTDAYRLFSALNRLCDTANFCYNSSPVQKYVLRQLKAMDYSIVPNARSKSQYHERASYSTKDENGNWIQAEDFDIALLMLYGHILYVGKSYSLSISMFIQRIGPYQIAYGLGLQFYQDYFLRAYALDPSNPMINLSLALGYIHYAIKRLADNRHHFIMQGFAFLFAYHGIRQDSNVALEKQEAEYNVARTYHMLGLTHLAIPYYLRCLIMDAEVRSVNSSVQAENFTREAAFALQGLWVASGDVDRAREVTEQWLVI